jgi:outer membrane receptor for ferrienterochelin and colicins
MKRYMIFLLMTQLFVGQLFAQKKTDANVFGHTISGGEHITGVHVYIKGTQIGTVTDRTGHYFLFNLPEGKHTLVASGIGFQPTEIEIEALANQTIEADFELQREVRVVQEVVITGSRIEQDRREVPVIVNVIKPELFKSTNSQNIADALGFQSGLRVENNCQNCGFQQVRMNGLEGSYSQILIDGRPIFSALSGVYGLEQIPISMIDRIEVVKGGGSATYGSNAIAGTINIITKEPLFNSFQVGHNTSAYSESTFDNNSFFNSTVLNNGNTGGISIFGNVRNRQAFDYDGDGFTEIPLFKMSSLGFKSFNRLTKNSKITVEYHNIADFRRGGNKLWTVPHKADITEQVGHRVNSGSVVFENLMKESKGKFSVFSSLRHTERDSYYGANFDPNAYGKSLDLVSYSGAEFLRFFHKGLLPNSLLLGTDYTFNDLIDRQLSYNRLIEQSTHNVGVFAQGQWKVSNFSLLTGVRMDRHNMMDDIMFSPRANLLYNTSEYLQIRLGFASGFRAPQAFDEDLHIMAVGGEAQLIELDEDLKPETSMSFTGSFEWSPKFANNKFSVLSEAFYTQLNDVFVLEAGGYDQQGNMVLIRTNGECARVMGVNTELLFSPHADFDIQLGFTFQKSEFLEPVEWSEDPNAELSTRMFRTPDQYGFINANWRTKKDFRFSLTGTYTGSMLVPHYAGYIEEDRLETTPTFMDVNFKLAKVFNLPRQLNLEVATGVKNMLNSFQKDFDKGPERDAGYLYGPIYPRHFFVSVKFGNIL